MDLPKFPLPSITGYLVRVVFPTKCLYYKPGKRFHWEEGCTAANILSKSTATAVFQRKWNFYDGITFPVPGSYQVELIELNCSTVQKVTVK